jgi:nickel-dependent lactate racemase
MSPQPVHHAIAAPGVSLAEDAVRPVVQRACAGVREGARVIVIVPDHTRTAPIGMMFRLVHEALAARTQALDVLIALGTHPPMSEEAILHRLEMTAAEKASRYARVQLINHAWDDPRELRDLGAIPAAEIRALSGGLFEMDVNVRCNRRLFDYDCILIIGPVFPHEVVGFSGGNKYLFPGVSGPEVLNFFHWLGAVVTNPMIIGNKWTPVRKVVDRAASMVDVPKLCFCLVVEGRQFAGVFASDPVSAWDRASELSRELHITYKDRPFRTILSVCPEMYDELWVGGKCMYKLEPVLADGGELIIWAPHIREVSATHGKLIERIGYHCRDFFLKQWDTYKDLPWGVLAHSTHVKGIGTYDAATGIETPRATVTLATGIPEEVCRRINLGYRDPATIRREDFENREHEGVLVVPKAGERLFHLREKPVWAGG